MVAGIADSLAKDRAPVIAITTGEPAGIGPEICMRLAAMRDAGLGGVEPFALAGHHAAVVVERAHVVIDLREVFGQLRFARRQVLAGRFDH